MDRVRSRDTCAFERASVILYHQISPLASQFFFCESYSKYKPVTELTHYTLYSHHHTARKLDLQHILVLHLNKAHIILKLDILATYLASLLLLAKSCGPICWKLRWPGSPRVSAGTVIHLGLV
jgi:hypothetical protein